MLRAVGAHDVEPLLKRLCIILGSPPDEAGSRARVWQIAGTGVFFDITSAEDDDPVLRFAIGGRYTVYFRMRQGEADGNAAGAFAASDDGKIWLAHKGILTLSTQANAATKRTKADYLENEGIERADLSIGGKIARWYPIACLDGQDCVPALVGFVEYCHHLREGLRGAATLDGVDPSTEDRPPSRVPPREEGWKTWVERAIGNALRKRLQESGLHAAPFRQADGLECDLLVQSPVQILFEIKKGNSPAHHYCAIGQLIAYRTFFDIPDAMLVAVLEKDARTEFRPAFRALNIELVEFTRQEGAPIVFFGLDALVRRVTS